MTIDPRSELWPGDEATEDSLPQPASDEASWPFQTTTSSDDAGETIRAIAEQAAKRRAAESPKPPSGLRKLLSLFWLG